MIYAENAFNLADWEGFIIYGVKIIWTGFATFVSSCFSSSSRSFIIGGGELRSSSATQGHPITMITYANATIPLFLMIIPTIHN